MVIILSFLGYFMKINYLKCQISVKYEEIVDLCAIMFLMMIERRKTTIIIYHIR